MKILIADDRPEVRSAIRILLEQNNASYLFEEVNDINYLVQRCGDIKPDVILLDWELSDQSMVTVIPVLRQLAPNLRIIAMSGRPEAEKAAFHAGADVFVSKGDNSDKLLHAIHGVEP